MIVMMLVATTMTGRAGTTQTIGKVKEDHSEVEVLEQNVRMIVNAFLGGRKLHAKPKRCWKLFTMTSIFDRF